MFDRMVKIMPKIAALSDRQWAGPLIRLPARRRVEPQISTRPSAA
jgi:hypothetical protein